MFNSTLKDSKRTFKAYRQGKADAARNVYSPPSTDDPRRWEAYMAGWYDSRTETERSITGRGAA